MPDNHPVQEKLWKERYALFYCYFLYLVLLYFGSKLFSSFPDTKRSWPYAFIVVGSVILASSLITRMLLACAHPERRR